MEGVTGTLYEGESFQLQFKFTNKYPFDSPEVRKTSGLYINLHTKILHIFISHFFKYLCGFYS